MSFVKHGAKEHKEEWYAIDFYSIKEEDHEYFLNLVIVKFGIKNINEVKWTFLLLLALS